MSKSDSLRAGDCRAIVQLVGECRDLGDDAVAWRMHWVSSLAALVDADLGFSGEMAGCRDLVPVDLGVTMWWSDGLFPPSILEAQLESLRDDPGYSPAMLRYHRENRDAGGLCLSRKMFIADGDWYGFQDHQSICEPYGIDHVLWCFRPINARTRQDESSGLVCCRAQGHRDFDGREVTLVREAHAALAPMVGGALARYGEPSPRDLAPRVRQVLACMLEGEGDKQIAARLSLSTYTVNQYTKVIFRHFGVRSRAELSARWIRRGWGSGFSWAE